MEKDKNTPEKIEEALECFDGIQKASPAPFFYTRVKALLEKTERNFWEKAGFFLARPVIATGVILIILLANTFFLFHQNRRSPAILTDQDEPRFENAYDIASNTNNTIISIFNRENEQQGQK